MDLSLFSALVRNLLQMNIQFCREGDRESLFQEFERKFCYHPTLQPAFTSGALTGFAAGMQDRVMYGLQDELGFCLFLFRFDENDFVVGPFVRREFDEDRIRKILVSHRAPASYSESLRLFYEGFPLIGSTSVRLTLQAFLRSFSGEVEDYAFIRLDSPEGKPPLHASMQQETLDYSALYEFEFS